MTPATKKALSGFFRAASEFVTPPEAVARVANVGATPWESPEWARSEFGAFYEALGADVRSVTIQNLLFDEWFFLMHKSWFVSRLKAPFQALGRAGAAGLELLNPMCGRRSK